MVDGRFALQVPGPPAIPNGLEFAQPGPDCKGRSASGNKACSNMEHPLAPSPGQRL